MVVGEEAVLDAEGDDGGGGGGCAQDEGLKVPISRLGVELRCLAEPFRARQRAQPEVRALVAHADGVSLVDSHSTQQEVKEHLGHSSIRVTSDRYAHLYPEARAAMADALDAPYRDASAAPPRPRAEIAHLR